jgi:hypothetical protein
MNPIPDNVRRRRQRPRRSGTIVVLTVFMMVVLFAALAFAIDLGVVFTAQTEMQRTADSAAIAGAWNLLEQELEAPAAFQKTAPVYNTAVQFASFNPVLNAAPQLGDGDVTIGRIDDLADREAAIDTSPVNHYNAVEVRVRRNQDRNGELPLFFARVMGFESVASDLSAMAGYYGAFSGFRTPSDGSNLGILPIALDQDTWDNLVDNKIGTDNFCWNPDTKQVESGSDGILEVNLYPQGVGLPGNRGTVDIGSSGNSTADIKRQILEGISPEDLAHHGGKLEFVNGVLPLNGDTGISAAVKDQLNQIKGSPRCIPVFSSASGNGNNANFTIVKFVGVRILEVQLTGKMSSKRVMVQPAGTIIRGGIPDTGTNHTEFVYSPVVLAR